MFRLDSTKGFSSQGSTFITEKVLYDHVAK